MTTKVKPSVLADTAVTAGTYGGSTQHSVFTVDAQGRLIYAGNATPSIATTQLTGTISSSQIASQSDPTWLTISKAKVGLSAVDNTADANKSVSYAATAGNGGVTSLAAGRGVTLNRTTGAITVSATTGKMNSSIRGYISRAVPNPTQQLFTVDWMDFSTATINTFDSNGDPTVCIGSFEMTSLTQDMGWDSGYFEASIRAVDTISGATHTEAGIFPVTLVACGREGTIKSANYIVSPTFILTSLSAGRTYKWQIRAYFGKLNNSSGSYVPWASSSLQEIQISGNMVAFEI